MASRVEFFFDCGSPWTWLGFCSMRALARDLDLGVRWRPVLLGAVFDAVNPGVYEFRERGCLAKRRYVEKDLQDWARAADLEIRFPPRVFPLKSVKVMRACLVMDERDAIEPFAAAAFEAYWRDEIDLGTDAGIAAVCTRLGIDAPELLREAGRDDIKARLRANTDELIARGGFGTPTIFVDGTDMYFGNDRIGLVRRALQTSAEACYLP